MARMTDTCHVLMEHILMLKTKDPQLAWLQAEMVAMLRDKGNQEELSYDFIEAQGESQ